MDHFPMSWGRPVRLFCVFRVGVALTGLVLDLPFAAGATMDLCCVVGLALRIVLDIVIWGGSATTPWTRSTPTRCTSVRSTERILLLRACSGHSQSCSSFDVIWKH